MNQSALNLESATPAHIDIPVESDTIETTTMSDDDVIAQMKASLTGKLNSLVDVLGQARESVQSLEQMLGAQCIRSTELVWNCKAVNTVLSQFLKQQCASWTAWAVHIDGQETTSNLEVSDLPNELVSIDVMIQSKDHLSGTPRIHGDLKTLVDWMIDQYDFAGLLDALESKAKSLAGSAYNECADRLIFDLGLNESSYRHSKLTTKGLVVDLQISPCGIMGTYDYNGMQEAHRFGKLFEEAEAATGISGLSRSFYALGEEIDHDRQPRPSREKFKPEMGTVEFSFFAGKIKATIPRADVAPLIAFLKMHSDQPLKVL